MMTTLTDNALSSDDGHGSLTFTVNELDLVLQFALRRFVIVSDHGVPNNFLGSEVKVQEL
jgi:hypothetical protein